MGSPLVRTGLFFVEVSLCGLVGSTFGALRALSPRNAISQRYAKQDDGNPPYPFRARIYQTTFI
jgi:hypothetical protein